MSYRTIGKSDLKLSAITFGAWAAGGWMWGGADRNDAIAAIRAAHEYGITSIDTAPAYGMGESEEVVAAAIKELPRDQVQILTKYGLRWDLPEPRGTVHMETEDNQGNALTMYRYASKESVIQEAENSLRRLGTDYIDLFQLHWPDTTTPIDETFEAIARLKEQGKIREAGVSNYSTAQVAEANKVTAVIANQVPYSILKRDIEAELIPSAIQNDIGIIVYSPLQRGLLTGKIKAGHHFNEGDGRLELPWFRGENLEKINGFLDRIKYIAEEKHVTLAQLFLAWTIAQPGITIALAGARNPKQAIENAGGMELSLSDEEITLIRDEAEKLSLTR